MFNKIEDFKTEWAYESASTLKIIKSLTEDSVKTKVYDEGRTLGFLTWHIVDTLLEMPEKCGIHISAAHGSIEETQNPEQLASFYERFAGEVLESVVTNWKDDMLLETINMYGEQWKRGFALRSLVSHQIHHRAQMTVLMRQAGLKVPGVYGPAKEEWGAYGMETQP